MAKLSLVRADDDWAPHLTQYADSTVFQTKEWLEFLSQTQSAEKVIAIVKDGTSIVGRFTGLITRKNGLRILGSPFPGWTTRYMGFNLEPKVSRSDALVALADFAFGDLNCLHVEVLDRQITTADLDMAGYIYDSQLSTGFEIDLTRDEDALLAAMSPSRKRYILRAPRAGLMIEATEDMSFANTYYAQLKQVFAGQRLSPTYSMDRVTALLEHMLPTGRLLLVQARIDGGQCVASAIFPAFNDTMVFWGGASLKQYHSLHPNEPIHWFAMRYWKARGIKKYDMGGGGEYKRTYGGSELKVPWGRRSRYTFCEYLRSGGKRYFALKQRIRGLRSQ